MYQIRIRRMLRRSPLLLVMLCFGFSVREELPQNKTLKALVVYSSTSYFLYKGKPLGFEYELLERLAEQSGRSLEIVVSKGIGELIPDLLAGKGDLIAHGLIITPERRAQVAFTEPINEIQPVLVQRKPENWQELSSSELQEKLVTTYRELIGDTISVSRGTAVEGRLKRFIDSVGGGIYVEVMPPEYSTGELIEMVDEGLIKYTIAHDNIAGINASWMPGLDVSVPVGTTRSVGWAVRKESSELLDLLNAGVKRTRTSTAYAVTYNKYFKNQKYFETRIKSPFYSLKNKQISLFDDIIKKEAARIDWDWRLVASVVYQESRFNPKVESWAGAVGLMQLMPNTAKSLGVANPADPAQNIAGGCKYLGRLYGRFSEIPDSIQRFKFAMASYNCGIGHVFDAQRLAAARGLDRNIWDHNVEHMLVELSDPENYQEPIIRYGYVRGNQAYNYVRDIFNRYDHYSYFID